MSGRSICKYPRHEHWRFFVIGALASLASGCASTQPAAIPGAAQDLLRSAPQLDRIVCPANPNGNGLLTDGDFSQAFDPGHGFKQLTKPAQFAAGWTVSRLNVDFYGSTTWRMAGYCSVDLDGGRAGGIQSAPFDTTSGAIYYVTFLVSGNGGSKSRDKKFKLSAAGQSQVFGCNTRHGNSVQNGKYASATWIFTARGSKTRLQFRSLDHFYYRSGAMIAAISVSTNPPQR